MNLILYKDNSIKYFIKDCVSKGSSYIGSNMRLDGVNSSRWSFKWTLEVPTPIYDKEDKVIGYEESVSELQEAPKFIDTFVGSIEDVDTVIKKEVSIKYNIEDELKLLRRKDKEFDEYNLFVEALVQQGRDFKEKYFKESVINGTL